MSRFLTASPVTAFLTLLLALLFPSFSVPTLTSNTSFSRYYEETWEDSPFINSLTFQNRETDFQSFQILEKGPLCGTLTDVKLISRSFFSPPHSLLEPTVAKQFPNIFRGKIQGGRKQMYREGGRKHMRKTVTGRINTCVILKD